jgi:hypothetical protein
MRYEMQRLGENRTSSWMVKSHLSGKEGLVNLLREPQADGTLRFSMSNNMDDSLKIGDIDPSELSPLLLDKIKKLVVGWF